MCHVCINTHIRQIKILPPVAEQWAVPWCVSRFTDFWVNASAAMWLWKSNLQGTKAKSANLWSVCSIYVPMVTTEMNIKSDNASCSCPWLPEELRPHFVLTWCVSGWFDYQASAKMLSPMLPLACERVTIVKALWHRIKTLTYRSSISVN